jgi:hypothetical protein
MSASLKLGPLRTFIAAFKYSIVRNLWQNSVPSLLNLQLNKLNAVAAEAP